MTGRCSRFQPFNAFLTVPVNAITIDQRNTQCILRISIPCRRLPDQCFHRIRLLGHPLSSR